MDTKKLGGSCGTAIDKLKESNSHVWKQKINLILTYREVDSVRFQPNTFQEGSPEYLQWIQCDKLASAVTGLSLSDDMLEHVRGVTSGKEMYEYICILFQRHTLLYKLRARRDFYTVKMNSGEKLSSYINRVQQLGQMLKAMDVNIDRKETAMAILNGLAPQYENIITTRDALGDDSSGFTLYVVKSQPLQEEERRDMSHINASEPVLFSSNRFDFHPAQTHFCSYCKRRGHTDDRCWDENPSLRHKQYNRPQTSQKVQAFLADTNKNNYQGGSGSCLLAFSHRL